MSYIKEVVQQIDLFVDNQLLNLEIYIHNIIPVHELTSLHEELQVLCNTPITNSRVLHD